MIRHVGMHRTDDAQVVGQFTDVLEDLGNFQPALAVLLECEGRLERRACLAFGGPIGRDRLAVVLGEHRLGVERIDMRRPAVHEQMHDPFCLAGKLRRLRQHRRYRAARRACDIGGIGLRGQARVGHQIPQRQRAEPHPASAQSFAARDGLIRGIEIVGHDRRLSIKRGFRPGR